MALQRALANPSLPEARLMEYYAQWAMAASRPVNVNGHYYVFPVVGIHEINFTIGGFNAHRNPDGRDAVDISNTGVQGMLPIVAVTGGYLEWVVNRSGGKPPFFW